MTQIGMNDAAERFALNNELHARPFPKLTPPCRAICLALRRIAPVADGGDVARAGLLALLDRFGTTHPPEGANHFFGRIGRVDLKWERHTEFETYSFFVPQRDLTSQGAKAPPYPLDWAASLEAEILTAMSVDVIQVEGIEALDTVLEQQVLPQYVPESLAASAVLDGAAIIASDFRIDTNGFVRFSIVADVATGPRRLGRITQRLIEIETYKSMAMLTLPKARDVAGRLSVMDQRLAGIVADMTDPDHGSEAELGPLLQISAEIEDLSARNASRFSAAKAYDAIVSQRIAVLRETRHRGLQTFGEFMMRRFDPAMRTCAATADRLAAIAERAARAAELLRTRADVAREEQNQAILARMDERAAQQLKLQKTVEGLSVVAVSYYAVNLAAYALAPFAKPLGLDKTMLTAALTLPVIALVWWLIHRIRKHF